MDQKFYYRKSILEDKLSDDNKTLTEGFVVAKDYNIKGGKMFTFFDGWRNYLDYVDINDIPIQDMHFYEAYVNGMDLKINFDLDFADLKNVNRIRYINHGIDTNSINKSKFNVDHIRSESNNKITESDEIPREDMFKVIDGIKSIINVQNDSRFIIDSSSRFGYHLTYNDKHFEGYDAWNRMKNLSKSVKFELFNDLKLTSSGDEYLSNAIDTKVYKSFYLMKMRGNSKMSNIFDINDIKQYEEGDKEFWKSLITIVGSRSTII